MLRPNDLCSAAYYGDVKKIQELLALEPVEDDAPLDPNFDPLAPPDDEAAKVEQDRQAKRDENTAELLRRLSKPGVLCCRKSPVQANKFGVFVRAVEVAGSNFMKQFVPSQKSAIMATPIIWAVLGREHAAITALVMKGANTEVKVETLDVSAEDICHVNHSHETLRVLREAKSEYSGMIAKAQQARTDRLAELVRREKLRVEAAAQSKAAEEQPPAPEPTEEG